MSPSPKTIYDEARHYDLLMPGPGDSPFYLRQFEKYGGPALELGCGTGRLTIPLRKQGAEITGLDSSESMLELARVKAERSSITIEFVQADAPGFLPGPSIRFDLHRTEHYMSHVAKRRCRGYVALGTPPLESRRTVPRGRLHTVLTDSGAKSGAAIFHW